MKRTSAIFLLLAGCAYAPQPSGRAEQLALEPTLRGPGSLPLRNALHFESTGQWLVEPKIVGGALAVPGQDPWQVALVAAERTDKNIVFCGGSLVAQNWVLTAAHCLDGGTVPSQVDVVSGTIDLDRGGRRVRVAQIFVHTGWDTQTNNNDVALLRLMETAPGMPIALVTAATEFQVIPPRTHVRVTGWGRTQQGGQTVRQLRTVDVPVVSRDDCNDRVSYNGAITANMICAGWQHGGADSCQGDSGGPLTAPTGARRLLVGVVSWGHGCAQPNKYGVYTRLAQYADWTEQCMAGRICQIR